MTTKKASEIFNIPERKIRKLCQQNKIHGVSKPNGRYEIPDSTSIIITDDNARAFLYQLIKYKNNPGLVLSVAGLDTETKRLEWHMYLLEQGLIGQCEFCPDLRELLTRMVLTDKAIELVFGKQTNGLLSRLSLEPAININIACLNL